MTSLPVELLKMTAKDIDPPMNLIKQLKATLPYICEALQQGSEREQLIYRERIGMSKLIVHILFGEQVKI